VTNHTATDKDGSRIRRDSSSKPTKEDGEERKRGKCEQRRQQSTKITIYEFSTQRANQSQHFPPILLRNASGMDSSTYL
jgi:hypothetical protein